MMHYAETPNCRTQMIRVYFGDAEGEHCLRCDNCAKTHEVEHHPALDVIGYHRKKDGDVGTAGTAGPIAAPQKVVTVQTPCGEIRTTAPETLVRTDDTEPCFRKGDEVYHEKFGTGKVLAVENDMVSVDFLKGASKRLRADFLQATD